MPNIPFTSIIHVVHVIHINLRSAARKHAAEGCAMTDVT